MHSQARPCVARIAALVLHAAVATRVRYGSPLPADCRSFHRWPAARFLATREGGRMRDRDIDGRLQVTAALSLLDCSRLVEWKRESDQFVAVSREVFEYSWRRDVDPLF